MREVQNDEIQFFRANNKTCPNAQGLVVVIDVLRAFSTAAYAFGAGARDILLASTVEEALALHGRFPEALLMGEVGGLPVEGFDFSNSPADFIGADLDGCRLIQRTSAGTQGVVRSRQATTLLGSSLVVASASARYIRQQKPHMITFVLTGSGGAGWENESGIEAALWGDEDAACADYLEALLKGYTPAPDPYLERVWNSPSGHIFRDPNRPDYPAVDVSYCAKVDVFDFALVIRRETDLLIMEKINPDR